jgi:hypothetical protein
MGITKTTAPATTTTSSLVHQNILQHRIVVEGVINYTGMP